MCLLALTKERSAGAQGSSKALGGYMFRACGKISVLTLASLLEGRSDSSASDRTEGSASDFREVVLPLLTGSALQTEIAVTHSKQTIGAKSNR